MEPEDSSYSHYETKYDRREKKREKKRKMKMHGAGLRRTQDLIVEHSNEVREDDE